MSNNTLQPFHLIHPRRSRSQLEQETLRVFDICDGCRRCFNLCPSFNTLLERIDDQESDLTKLTPSDFERIEQECYFCKLCYNHCPYTPPHQYAIDFPRLMVTWKQQRVKEKGTSWRDKLLPKTDLLGKIGSLTAPFSNWLLKQPFLRSIMKSLVGLHQDRQVLPFQRETFSQWWTRRRPQILPTPPNGKVAIFPGCLVTYQATDIGKATIQVLEKNGIEVVVPDGQQCCGMPSFDLGDTDTMIAAATRHAKIFQPWIEKGFDVVIPTPSCSLMFKREYPYLCSDQSVNILASRTFDISEYLMRLKQEGHLSLDFSDSPGKIAYQIPCHLRDQNIGFKSKELMELTGAEVRLIERCSGHDGTWSAKVEFFDLSMKIANKAVRAIGHDMGQILASDCPLSALQLDQARSTGKVVGGHTLHPIQIIRDAYNISS